MSKKRVLHLNNPLKWNLDIYEDDTPGFRKLRIAFLGAALGFLVLGVVVSFMTGSSYPFRAAGTASFLFAFLCDRLKPGYKEFWKAMGYALFFFVGGLLLRSMAEAALIMGLWFLLLLSRWRGFRTLWQEETRGYKILLVSGLLVLTAVLWAFLWNQAEIAELGG